MISITDEEKDNILYRPQLKPDLNYRSDGNFTEAITDKIAEKLEDIEQQEEQVIDETPSVLMADYQEVIELIDQLPDEVHFLAKTVEKLKERVNVAFPQGVVIEEKPEYYSPNEVNPPGEFTYLFTPVEEVEEEDIDVPDMFPPAMDVDLKIEVPKTLVEIVKERYDQDTLQLNEDYLQKLQSTMQRYFQQMLMIMSDAGLQSITYLTKDFDGESVQIPENQDLEHLRDYIVKSQTIRNQKTRLFKKTHSVDQTLVHLRAWHVSEALRERYYKENYKDSEQYSESHSNALLRDCRSSYDTAYANSLYNMYKYLNSSVILVNDTLDMTVKEAQAKAMLLKAGVNIYETSDTATSS